MNAASEWLEESHALIEILGAENAALRALDAPAAAKLLMRKQAAATAFELLHRRIAAPPPPELMRRLADLADENRRLLEHAIAVQRRVIEVLVHAIPAALSRAPAAAPRYSARGTLAEPAGGAWTLRARA